MHDRIAPNTDFVILSAPEDKFTEALVAKSEACSLQVTALTGAEFWPLVSISTKGQDVVVWPMLPLLMREEYHDSEHVDTSSQNPGRFEETFSLAVTYARLSPAPIVNRPLLGNTFYLVGGAASRILEKKMSLRCSRREIFAGTSTILRRQSRGLWCKDWSTGKVFSADDLLISSESCGPIWARDALSAGCYSIFIVVGDWVHHVTSAESSGQDNMADILSVESKRVVHCLGMVMATIIWYHQQDALSFLVGVEPVIDDFIFGHLSREKGETLLEKTLQVLLK